MLDAESDKKVRNLLCLHQVFRVSHEALFNNPDGLLWDAYEAAMEAVRQDRDLNMDYQWKQSLGKKGTVDGYDIGAASLGGEARPENPRLEEAFNMVSLRPTVRDMEMETSIFLNAVKEYPLLPQREALYRACREIYVSVDRDLYFFMGAVDRFYGTEYVKRAGDIIMETKREDPVYRSAEAYLAKIEEKGFSGQRKAIFRQELEGYTAIVRMNRELSFSPHRDVDGKKIRFPDYKGMDISWADGRIPSEKAVHDHFISGLEVLLEKSVGRAAMKPEKMFRRYEALWDKVFAASFLEKPGILSLHASDILYGFGYARWREEKQAGLVPSKGGSENDGLSR